jgi:hypothetical protein
VNLAEGFGNFGDFPEKQPADDVVPETGLLLARSSRHREPMGLPTQPVTLSAEQIAELNQKLSTFRHDVNNHLSLIMAAVEMVRFKPELASRMMDTLTQQPPRITEAIAKLSAEVEHALGITRL